MLEDLGAPLGPEEQEGYERTVARLASELGPDAFSALRAEGRALALADVVVLATR